LILLREALANRSYQPDRSVCFFTTRPKLREIFAADFRDRVPHHVLVDYLERIWEPIFIRQATANGTRPAWYLQLDIRNYFMSIDKRLLFDFLAAKMNDPDALWLARVMVFHDCNPGLRDEGRCGPVWQAAAA